MYLTKYGTMIIVVDVVFVIGADTDATIIILFVIRVNILVRDDHILFECGGGMCTSIRSIIYRFSISTILVAIIPIITWIFYIFLLQDTVIGWWWRIISLRVGIVHMGPITGKMTKVNRSINNAKIN